MRTLLLADDSVTVQRVIALTFAEEPIRVVTVADGQQAMEKMAAQRPDIVLAGTALPQVSGYELAQFMRSRADLQQVPVLLLSGAFETIDPERLKASGANGILEKPVEPSIVIGRVKELLGINRADATPVAPGRMVTPAEPPAHAGDVTEKRVPAATPPRAVTSTIGTPSRWEQLRNQTGLDSNTRSVEDSSTRSDDYLDTLDAAFDTLDQQLSGRMPAAKPQRNPSGPLSPSAGAADPRSPGRKPANGGPQPGNPVFEVDDDWFGGNQPQAPAEARDARREIREDLEDPELRPQAAPSNPIYEVDDQWFAEDEKAKAQRLVEQQHLAAEMGIHEVDLPELAPAGEPVRPSPSDLGFAPDDLRGIQAAPGEAPAPPPVAPPAPGPAPAAPAVAPLLTMAPIASVAATPAAHAPAAPAPLTPRGASVIADDFAALLAYEQGEHPHPPVTPPPPVEVKVVMPEITEDMLEQIAKRVAARLSASTFGDDLKSTMAATMRDTVRSVVSETSERLVRDEIERIKSRKSQ